MNYLRPGIKRGNISEDEEDLIVRLHGLLGNRWSLIAGRLPGRTDNEIKNYWNTHLLKKLKTAAGADAATAEKEVPKSKKKKSKQSKKSADNAAKSTPPPPPPPPQPKEEASKDDDEEEAEDPPPMRTKVYLPKPIRVSSVFSRTNSYDSLASGASSSDAAEKPAAAEVVSFLPVAWPPLFEMDVGDYVGCGGGDEFLDGGFILPVLNHSDSISSDVNMLEKVYDEYLQLL